MKFTSTILLAMGIVLVTAFGLKAQGNAPAAEAAKAPVAGEMPPALKNMQGTPGYEAERQKWEQSQNPSAVRSQAEAQKNVKALQGAKWAAPSTPTKASSSSEGAPYHQYKGIADPAEAKKAWVKDQNSGSK